MGLDMFLYKVKHDEVAYWRKANAIHAWFERKYGDGEELENCKEYNVTREDLIELRDTCQKVINESKLVDGPVKNGEHMTKTGWLPMYEQGKIIENPKVAQELLPTQSGFFFGSTDYNQYYIIDLENTVRQIDRILETTDFDRETICYSAWW